MPSRECRDNPSLVHPGPMLYKKAENVKYEAFAGFASKPGK